jgi:hypothetical protein
MSKPSTLLFTVTLRHLSVDGKKVGADLPKAQVPYVAADQLLKLLKSVEELGSAIVFPAEPEVRISGGPGEFVVRAKGGELHLVSWSKAHKGGVYTADQIVAAITNEGGEEEFAAGASPTSSGGKSLREKATMALMGLAIVGINTFTIWFLTKPPRSLVGDYRALPAERAERVITQVAGTYETGKKPGDRRLEIVTPATGKRLKYASGGSVKDVQTFEVKPVEAGGNVALLTSRKSLIKVKDNVSVVLYGDTYTRVQN